MKNLISLLAIALFSTSVFAARFPTQDEFLDYAKMIESSNTIKPLIDAIKSGKLNPMVERNKNWEVVSVAGRSAFASYLVFQRMNVSTPIGSEKENYELLEIMTRLGLNFNITQPSAKWSGEEERLMDYASNNCASKAIDLMEANGADLGADGYWVYAFKKSLEFDLNTAEDLACSNLSLKLLKKTTDINLKTIYLLLSDSWGVNQNKFLKGTSLDKNMKGELKNLLKEKFDVTFSKRPQGIASQTLKDIITEKIGPPSAGNDQHGPDFWELWWPKLNSEEKAWACYFSTFDEAFPLLKKVGLTEDEIMHSPLPYSRSPMFGEFAVKILVPYCDSIRF